MIIQRAINQCFLKCHCNYSLYMVQNNILRVFTEKKLFFTYSVNWYMEQRHCMEFSLIFFFSMFPAEQCHN